MGYKVDNAIILAAGTSSRFVPLSYEKPKALIKVKGEALIERQIRQLKEAKIPQIVVVTGYRSEMLQYLEKEPGVILLYNKEYETRNNHASIWTARGYLKNSYICSSDNYFTENPFEPEVEESYYSAVYAPGKTSEWCVSFDSDGWITDVNIGGSGQWYMMGHVFFSEVFSARFFFFFEAVYDTECVKGKLWEDIYVENIGSLFMKIRKYGNHLIYEFDSLDELRRFDSAYINDTGSVIMKKISEKLKCMQADINECKPVVDGSNEAVGFSFVAKGEKYQYKYATGELIRSL